MGSSGTLIVSVREREPATVGFRATPVDVMFQQERWPGQLTFGSDSSSVPDHVTVPPSYVCVVEGSRVGRLGVAEVLIVFMALLIPASARWYAWFRAFDTVAAREFD